MRSDNVPGPRPQLYRSSPRGFDFDFGRFITNDALNPQATIVMVQLSGTVKAALSLLLPHSVFSEHAPEGGCATGAHCKIVSPSVFSVELGV